jgi:radical SAM superfamily enzyme YgiQ (UPF0313 family)
MRTLLISANREKLPSPVVPLGVLSVAGALRDAHEVEVLDLCFADSPLAAVAEAVARFAPEVVGIGLRNLHSNAYDGTDGLIDEYAAISETVRRHTGAPLVIGGSGFSLQPERLLTRLGGDFGVIGEGERVLRELVDTLAHGGRPPRLLRAGAAAATLAPTPLLRKARLYAQSDLDLLSPPARDLVDPRYYEWDGTDNIQTKRGCAFLCAYCDYPDLEGNRVRVRDPQKIADEVLDRASVPGVCHIFFVDSVFNVPRAHALSLCRALIDRGTPIPWSCYLSPATFNEELACAMAQAGCVGVEVGSDAGNERMLSRLRKPFHLRDIVRTHELLVAYGIHGCNTFVLGALDETPDEVRLTLDFVDQLNPDLAMFIAFMEDRESMTIHRARHRENILELLAQEAPRRPGWIVPELGIRFNSDIGQLLRRKGLKGPSWIHLARIRRRHLDTVTQRGDP